MFHDHKLTAAHREFGRKDAEQRADHKTELSDIMAALAKRDSEIQDFARKAQEEIKATGAMATETKSALDAIARSGADLQARLVEVEQKLARRGGMDGPALKSLGEQMTESEDFKRLSANGGQKGRARIATKAVTTITSATTGTGGVGDAIRPDRLAGVIQPAQRQMTIRDLLMQGRTSSNAIEYVKETGFQNMAAPVAEGALKPQSDLAFDLVTTNVRTLAHWFLASRQVLSDIPQLQSYIDGRARYGLQYLEEAQLLAGDGTGQNLLGIIPQATAYAFATYSAAGDGKIDRLRRAILQVRVAEYRATGFVMNPIDWADIQLVKDGQGRYIWSDPHVNNGMNIWGLPVVDTTAIAAGKFLCGAFKMAGQVFDREDAAVEVSSEDSDNFRKNLVTILAEERLALAIFRPESFVYGNLVTGNAS